jgi:hypothetical protein
MTTIGMQMPQMFLRGSFVNVTIKNLTNEEQAEIAKIVEWIKDDPLLQPSRYQFKCALRNTIKGDYLDEEAADQEYQIALWKAAVAAKHGWGKHGPSEQTIVDKFQRKKFFQTWIFNYLKQILHENKRAYFTHTSSVIKPTYEAAKEEFLRVLGRVGKIKTDNPGKYCVITGSLFLLSSSKIGELLMLRQKYFNKKIKIEISDDEVKITDSGSVGHEMIEISTPTLVGVKSTSPSNNDDDKGTDIPDLSACGFDNPDTIEAMYDALSDDAQRIMKMIIDPSDSYIKKYGEKPIKKYIQEHLKLSPKQMKDIWSEMKLAYVAIIGTPD